ncbi:hypothetical protein [Shimia sediminis]|nr:hypothetical protein [Shimia sediminis]
MAALMIDVAESMGLKTNIHHDRRADDLWTGQKNSEVAIAWS